MEQCSEKNELKNLIFDKKPKSTSLRTYFLIALIVADFVLKYFNINIFSYDYVKDFKLDFLIGFLTLYYLMSFSMDKDRLNMEKYYLEKRSKLNKKESNMHLKWYLETQEKYDLLKSQLPS